MCGYEKAGIARTNTGTIKVQKTTQYTTACPTRMNCFADVFYTESTKNINRNADDSGIFHTHIPMSRDSVMRDHPTKLSSGPVGGTSVKVVPVLLTLASLDGKTYW